jgi:hypothetical protein
LAAFTTSILENIRENSEVCGRQRNSEGKKEVVYMGAARDTKNKM